MNPKNGSTPNYFDFPAAADSRAGAETSGCLPVVRAPGTSVAVPLSAHAVGVAKATQRSRIVAAMMEVVGERGFAAVSVKLVTAQAGVSSRTFYECFDSLEDCFTAVLDAGLAQATRLITDAFVEADRWEDGVLAALASVLAFFDAEPRLARVWFVESMAAGSMALERRERIITVLRSVIVRPWSDLVPEEPDAFTVAGIMASVLGLIHSHLVRKTPLLELLGPLMGLIAAPYLEKSDVARQVERGKEAARSIAARSL